MMMEFKLKQLGHSELCLFASVIISKGFEPLAHKTGLIMFYTMHFDLHETYVFVRQFQWPYLQ